jgi:hypothetical protein
MYWDCIGTNAVVAVQVTGFADASVLIPARSAATTHLDIHLVVEVAQTSVEVSGDSNVDSEDAATALNTRAVQGFALAEIRSLLELAESLA